MTESFLTVAQRALAFARLGHRRAAYELLRPHADRVECQALIAQLLLPGPDYGAVLRRIHALVRPAAYLEIGVETGATLRLAAAARVAVGIDPDLSRLAGSPLPNARLFALASDDFFARHDRAEVLAGLPLDLGFIDGLHLFEQVLRDFIHVERWAAPNTVVVLHDCLAVVPNVAQRVRGDGFWVGDTWKLLECLVTDRPDLEIHVIPTAPSGLVVIRGLDPASSVLTDALPELVARYSATAEAPEPTTWASRYPLVSNDESGVATALGV